MLAHLLALPRHFVGFATSGVASTSPPRPSTHRFLAHRSGLGCTPDSQQDAPGRSRHVPATTGGYRRFGRWLSLHAGGGGVRRRGGVSEDIARLAACLETPSDRPIA